jgi:hypothetical protein
VTGHAHATALGRCRFRRTNLETEDVPAFRPDGKVQAAGYEDKPSVDILDGHSLARLSGPNVNGLYGGELMRVAWSTNRDAAAGFLASAGLNALNRKGTPSHGRLSPLAPTSFPALPDVEGVRFATGAAGIRDNDRTDVMLAVFGKGTQAAGGVTKSKCPSAGPKEN